MSLPSWERGLKFRNEIVERMSRGVAPFVGAWIEIFCPHTPSCTGMSLPSWERGLKCNIRKNKQAPICRSLRGSVD